MKDKDISFERNSLVLFGLMMVSNVFNYLFQIVVGNLVNVEEYAQINTVLSLIAILTIPTSIITIICARYMAISEDDEMLYSQVIKTLLILAGMVVAFLAVGVTLLSHPVKSVLSLQTTGYLWGAMIVSAFMMFNAICLGILQGKRLFFEYGIENLIATTGKLIFSIAFVIAGARVYGVIGAIVLGLILSIFYGISKTKKLFLNIFHGKKAFFAKKKEFLSYTVGAVMAQGTVILLTNGDMLLVKSFFSDREAGLYSSAMVIGKIAIYVSTAVVATMFPIVAQKHKMNQDTKPLLKKALVYGGGTSLICAIGLVFLGRLIIGVFFGEKYNEALSLIPAVCAYVVPLTFVTILMNYLLAINKTSLFNTLMLIAVVLIIVICLLFHQSIINMISACGFVLLLSLILCVLIIWIKGE